MFTLIILAAYAAAIIGLSCFHEVWRDEVLPVTLVTESQSLFDLFSNIRNYGHPGLWFAILYGAYHIFPSYIIINIVNLAINLLAAYIFVKQAPFGRIPKAAFLLGYFPLYYYPVVNRHYGLCWLLFLLFCVLYQERWKKIGLLSAVLFLLANTHALGLVIVIAIAAVLAGELCLRPRQVLAECSRSRIMAGLGLVAAGIAISIWQVRTDDNSTLFSWASLSLPQAVDVLKRAVLMPGSIFSHILGGDHGQRVQVAILGCLVLLWRRWSALGIFVLSAVGMGLFLKLVFPNYSPYHESFLLMLMVFAFWVSADKYQKGSPWFYGRQVFFALILGSQILMAYPAIKADITSDFSSSKRFGQWIKSQPQGEDHVLVPEPDVIVESMPYYVSNDIYLPREGRFGKMSRNTLNNRRVFSLDEFLATAEAVRSDGRSVFLVLWHELKDDGPFEIRYSHDRRFLYSPQSLQLWREKTQKVASFRGSLDTKENYDVYRLK